MNLLQSNLQSINDKVIDLFADSYGSTSTSNLTTGTGITISNNTNIYWTICKHIG